MNVSSMDAQDLLVHNFLAAVADAAADLPAAVREELLADLREHIAVARVQYAPTEAGVRTILDRLGHPVAIADAARGFAYGPVGGWGWVPRTQRSAAPMAEPGGSLAALWDRSPLAVAIIVIAVLGALVLVVGVAAVSVGTPAVR
jgi:hypothetical protein